MSEHTQKTDESELYRQASEQAETLLQQLSIEEKISLTGGVRGFYIRSIPSQNIPEVLMADASCGVNIREDWLGESVEMHIKESVAFPCLLQLAATWNTSLAYNYARSIGEECRAAGVAFLLGPGMNIYRHAQCGRNFEYLGEDPFLAASFIKEYVPGLQSTGVAATLKHFIANNSDFFRRRSNSVVDDRSLREIYMPAFAAGIEAGAKAVMTAYNLLNGEWCSQSKELIQNILRKELGFQWLVMTDWWAIEDCEKAVKSGLDIEMPAREVLGDIENLLAQGKIDEQDIDRMVKSIITTCIALGFYDENFRQPEMLDRFGDHEQVAMQTASEGIVLLKNDSAVLPLSSGQKILVTGRFVNETAAGGGAASVRGFNNTSLLHELEQELGSAIRYVENPDDKEIAAADVVLLSTGTLDSEGCDRSFELPEAEEAVIRRTVGLNPRTVVLVSSGSGIRMTDWNDKAAAVIYAWYGGQTGNRALARVISGKINPSGKLPITIERDFSDSPGYGYLPEGEELYHGWNDETEKTHKVFDVPYREGILVGYRWYDTKKIAPLYPFGHGVSYTSFEYSNLRISAPRIGQEESITVELDVRNTGSTDGAEIVQVYVSDSESSVLRPDKELKGFSRLTLAAGESAGVSVTLTPRSFAFWDEKSRNWKVEPGEFRILVGASSRDIRLTGIVEVV
ncbi:beta-glucosidase family protein [Spirochaeta dissipatitropha]